MVDEYDGFMESHFAGPDAAVRNFYDKLSGMSSEWFPLEGEKGEYVNYRMTEMGGLSLGHLTNLFTEWPILEYFNYTQARNGGPIALMMKDNILLAQGGKNKIFIFDAYGKLFKIIDLLSPSNRVIEGVTEWEKWRLLAFNSDEDLVLMTNDGRLFIIDIILEKLKDKVVLSDYVRNAGESSLVSDAKLEGAHNTLVFRTIDTNFFWVPNVVTGMQPIIQPSAFKTIPRFQSLGKEPKVEFIILPKQDSQSKKMELFITDPSEGFHLLKEDQSHMYYRYQSEVEDQDDDDEDMETESKPFGLVKFMALNFKKDLLALYCDPEDEGLMFVMKANMQRLFSRKKTLQTNASSLCWSGNDCPVISVFNQLVIVGPVDQQCVQLNARTEGVFLQNEIDGMRVLTSEQSYFFESVKAATVNTFAIGSIDPAAKLHDAQKYIDFNNPCADQIIRELDKKLKTGIDTLLDAAKQEHHDIDVLKHLLTTASFAKKFCDPTDFAPDHYVDVVKHSIVLTKMRHSAHFARAITYTQLDKYKAKNIIRLLIKYRDYKLAILVIEQLNLKNLSVVYEDWCIQMLKHSQKRWQDLWHLFEEKFDELASKLAIDQGISFSIVQQALQEKRELKAMNLRNDLDPNQPQIIGGNNILNQVKLGIDFTKLAKLAQNHKRELSNFLILYEKQIVKKIPFYLQTGNYLEALEIAVNGGDPNNINKVFTEILKREMDSMEEVIEIAAKVREGLRHLRNYAKKRGVQGIPLLKEIYKFQKKSPLKDAEKLKMGLKPLGQDFTEIEHYISMAYKEKDIQMRQAFMQKVDESMREVYTDEFMRKTVEEARHVNEKQITLFKQTRGDTNLVDAPLGDFIFYYVGFNDVAKNKECQDLFRKLALNEQLYFSHVIRGYSDKLLWPEVQKLVKMKKCPVPFVTVAEILYAADNRELASDTFCKISDAELRIEKLIEYKFWGVAMDEMLRSRLNEDYEDRLIGFAQAEGASWVIAEWNRKKEVALR